MPWILSWRAGANYKLTIIYLRVLMGLLMTKQPRIQPPTPCVVVIRYDILMSCPPLLTRGTDNVLNELLREIHKHHSTSSPATNNDAIIIIITIASITRALQSVGRRTVHILRGWRQLMVVNAQSINSPLPTATPTKAWTPSNKPTSHPEIDCEAERGRMPRA